MKQRNNNACERIRPWLSAYADGELNKRQTAAVRAHVCTCSSCAQELEELEHVTALLKETAEDVAPSAQLHASVMRAVRQMPRTEKANSSRHVILKHVGGALACVGCLMVIGVAVMSGGTFDGIKNMGFDSVMAPEGQAPMEDAGASVGSPDFSYGTADKDTTNDQVSEEPETPMAPSDPMEPEADCPEDVGGEVGQYVLERVSGEGNTLDGTSTVWAGDDLKISVSASTRRIKIWFARESSREGSYELTDTELTVCFDDGECMSFDWKMEEDTLWLTRK